MTRKTDTFTEKVRDVVKHISKGTVLSYGQVAKLAGNGKAARAVANVMAHNYDPAVHCHRVVRADGGLGGYNRGGTDAKARLLISEGVTVQDKRIIF